MNSLVKGYHGYSDIWKPFINEQLTTALDLDNVVDKYAVCAKKKRCHSRIFTSW